MKYILIIDRIVNGGAERILVDYYHYLERKGCEPYIFALTGNLSQSKWVDGLRIMYGSSDDEDGFLKKCIQQFLLLLRFWRFFKLVKPVGVFSFLEKSNLITIFCPVYGVKKVVSVHNVLSIQYTKIRNNMVRKFVRKMIQLAYNHCSKVVAVSNQVKDDLIFSFGVKPQNIYVVNNYVERQKIIERSMLDVDDFVFKSGVKYVLNVGRFCDQKAQWKLIKAFSVYRSIAKENVELVLMGAGDYANDFQKLVSALNISSVVHILPFNVNPYKYMAKAHLFVLSSSFEGFPIVLAEISCLRIPFVGSRKSIPEEMFDEKTAWEECVFDCKEKECDLSTTIHDDEYQLANLIKKGVEDESFRKRILLHTERWECSNDKEMQFVKYNEMLGCCAN